MLDVRCFHLLAPCHPTRTNANSRRASTGEITSLYHHCRAEWRGQNDLCPRVSAQRRRGCSFCKHGFAGAGLSPLKPELAALKAGKLFLQELDRLAGSRLDFAFESTLSGLAYRSRLKRWKAAGYQIGIVFLRLASPQLALRRVAARVKQGGHHVGRVEVLRRFDRSWENFQVIYKPLADEWKVYDNSGDNPRLLQFKDEKEKR
jgi:predicted ABC-type ATPase